MKQTEVFIWAAAAVAVNLILLLVFGLSGLLVMLVSSVIVILFLLRQIMAVGVFQDYGKELGARFGAIEAVMHGLEWVTPLSDKRGSHCSMYVFPKHVVFVTPNPADAKKVDFLELDLNRVEQVRLSQQGHIALTVKDNSGAGQMFLKSDQAYDKVVKCVATLQAEIIHERKTQALREVGEKARQVNEMIRRGLEDRRRARVERLQKKGRELVGRFAGIVPEDIFIKDSLFEKCVELVRLEFNGRKSPLPGKLEGFLDNELKPFAIILKEKVGFDFEDEEDFIILLKTVREEVRRSLLKNFTVRYSAAFERLLDRPDCSIDAYTDVYLRLCSTAGRDLKTLEGFRLLLENRGFGVNLKNLAREIDTHLAELEEARRKHVLERKIIPGETIIKNIGDVDDLGEAEFAEFIKKTVTWPENEIEEVISGNLLLELIFKTDRKVLVHAIRTMTAVEAGDIEKTEQARISRGAGTAVIITTSFFTNDALKMAEEKGIIVWDRFTLEDEIKGT